MKLKQLIKSIGINKINFNDFEVEGISCNSNNVRDGFVFVAIKGNRQDGNEFIDEAIGNGAKIIITDNAKTKESKNKNVPAFIKVKDARKALGKLASAFYDNPSSEVKVAGITGTNGKTTVTYLMEAILNEARISCAVLGTINYRFGGKILTSKNTTPGPLELQSMLSDMRKHGVTYAVMEVSSHALDQARTLGIDFSSCIFTNLTQDHLDYHKTLENYFKSKARLFKDIGKNSFAVINNDDKYAARLKKICRARIITYGLKSNSAIYAKNIVFDCAQTVFSVVAQGSEFDIDSNLIGEHNVYNILAAVAWAKESGIGTKVIQKAISAFRLVPGRLERVNFKGDFKIFVDYAHTEDALKNIIRSLRPLCKKRIIVVFGCGGERDKGKRPKMGKVVSELSDYSIITTDNPRSEDPGQIIKDICKGIRKNNFSVVLDREQAIKKSISMAKAGDVVLVAGKGHENYQIIKNKHTRFDDREIVKKCLKSINS